MTEKNKVIRIFEPFILGFCKCGCNQEISVRTKHGDLARFKHNHSQRGITNSMYKNGFWTDKKGYVHVYAPNHPNRPKRGSNDKHSNHILAHRLVYEHYLFILFDEEVFIPDEYHIHHIIPVKEGGSNALVNLQLVTHEEHRKLHKKDFSDRFCVLCNSNKTSINKKNNSIWYKFQGGYICVRCYCINKKIEETNKRILR